MDELFASGKARRKKASKKHSKRPTQRGGNFLDSIMSLAPALLSALGKKKRASRKVSKKRVTKKRGGERVLASGNVFASGRKRTTKRTTRKRTTRKRTTRKPASRKPVGGKGPQVTRDMRSIKANLKKVMSALNRI